MTNLFILQLQVSNCWWTFEFRSFLNNFSFKNSRAPSPSPWWLYCAFKKTLDFPKAIITFDLEQHLSSFCRTYSVLQIRTKSRTLPFLGIICLPFTFNSLFLDTVAARTAWWCSSRFLLTMHHLQYLSGFLLVLFQGDFFFNPTNIPKYYFLFDFRQPIGIVFI